MRHFKDESGSLWGVESNGTQDHLIQENWVELTEEDLEAIRNPKVEIKGSHVDFERDRRIDNGFYFDGVKYQSKSEDRENIAGAAQLAFQSIVLGIPWPEGYVWISDSNERIPMDAQKVLEFSKAAAEHKQAHIFAGSDLKIHEEGIPEDYPDDKWWP